MDRPVRRGRAATAGVAGTATASFGSGKGSCLMRPSLHRHDADEVVPFEKHLYLAEAGAEQQVAVLAEAIGDQHVLERLALLRDLELAVAAAALVCVVALDEEPVEQRPVAEHLLDQ